MRALKYPPLADLAGMTGTAVIYRELKGEPTMVVVCGECEEIHTIGIREAMHAALNNFLKGHYDNRHATENALTVQGQEAERD